MTRILFFVAAGGALGSMLRYLMQRFINPISGDAFPTGTWLANMLGCLLIGIIWGLSEKHYTMAEETKFFLLTGICGGFTTLSAFSQESLVLIKAERLYVFACYFLLTIAGGWIATWSGYKLFST